MISRIVAIRDNRSSGQPCRGNLISAESVFDGAQALWFIRDEYVRGGVDKNSWHPLYPSAATYLPAEISFARDEREIFSEVSQSRGKSAIPAMYIYIYIYTLAISLHKFCLSSLFFPASFGSNSWKSNGRTMAAYPRPVNLRSTIINFHYVTIVFLPNLENIYTGKNVSSRTMNNFYVTLSCSLARVPSPFVIRNRWKLDDTYSGWFSIRFCVSLKF